MTGWGTRTSAVAVLGAVLALLLLAPAGAGAQTAATPSAPERPDSTKVVGINVEDPLELLQQPADEVKLSDEERVTRWAHAQDTGKIRLSPVATSRTITRLRFLTEDGAAEVYVVLAARMDSAGR